LVTKVGTSVLWLRAFLAIVVLQAETCFMPFGHSLPVARIEKIKVGEHFHTVIMTMTSVPIPDMLRHEGPEVRGAYVTDARRKSQKSSRLIEPSYDIKKYEGDKNMIWIYFTDNYNIGHD